MSTELLAPPSFKVEISGWDLNEDFFVEKTELEWTEEVKTIHVQHSVQQGTLVFIRLMGSSIVEVSCPVAYEAAAVNYLPQLLAYEISLKQIQPKTHRAPHF
jgi:hypothetical protein